MDFDMTSDKYPFLKVSPESETIPDESCIIFAPNGTGKSTLFYILLEKNPQDAIGFTYDPGDATYHKMELKTKSIQVDPTPIAYLSVHSKCEDLRKELGTVDRIEKGLGIKKKDLKTMPPFLSQAYSKGRLEKVVPLTKQQRDALRPLLQDPKDVQKALASIDELKKAAKESKELEAFILAHIDIATAFSYVRLDKHKEEIENNGCPFCGGKGETGNTFLDMMKKKDSLNLDKVVLFRDYSFTKGVYDSKELLKLIDDVLAALNNLSDEQLITLLFTSGKEELEKEYGDKIKDLSEQEAKEQSLFSEKESRFNAMKEAKPYIEKGFSEEYPGCSIELDEQSKTISIITSRPPNTYSEGEKHDMYSRILQLSVLGSSRKYLLVDDPLTELDAANEYKFVFRFVNLLNDANKTIIVFTCNANMINLATKQAGNKFKFYYLESSKNGLGEVEARLSKMKFGEVKTGRPYLTLKKLLSGGEPSSDSSVQKRAAYLIAKRACIEVAGDKEDASFGEASKVLHYDSPFHSNIFHLSNDDLYQFADGFVVPANLSFYEMVETKMCLLASLRVYVERMIYLYDLERSSKKFPRLFSEGGEEKLSLTDKVLMVEKATDYSIKNCYPKWDRKALMQLKTMLNDGDHPFGLVQPLFFAMAIGWDAFSRDIKDIKELFAKSIS